MAEQTRVVIVGGGFAGVACGLRLAREPRWRLMPFHAVTVTGSPHIGQGFSSSGSDIFDQTL